MREFPIQEYLQDLKTLCAIDSGDQNAAGTSAVADFLEERYRALGLEVERRYYNGNDFAPFVTAKNSCEGPFDVLLVAHMDTVFPVGTAAERPFAVDGNNIGHGPGCVDCKGGCLLIYYLLRSLLEENAVNFSFCVAMNSDEERGSLYSRPYFEELARKTKYCFVFEPGRPNDEYVSRRKGGAKYLIRCHGVAAHSGVEPEKGASAILELAKWVTELYQLIDYEKGTTLNIGRFQGGADNGSVPDYAEFTLSFLYLDEAALEPLHAMLQRMREHPFDGRTQIEIEEKLLRPPMIPTQATRELLDKLAEAAKEAGTTAEHLCTGGGSDGNHIAPLGPATLDGCGPCGGKLHTKEEYLKIGTVATRYETMFRLLKMLF